MRKLEQRSFGGIRVPRRNPSIFGGRLCCDIGASATLQTAQRCETLESDLLEAEKQIRNAFLGNQIATNEPRSGGPQILTDIRFLDPRLLWGGIAKQIFAELDLQMRAVDAPTRKLIDTGPQRMSVPGASQQRRIL